MGGYLGLCDNYLFYFDKHWQNGTACCDDLKEPSRRPGVSWVLYVKFVHIIFFDV